MGWKPLLMGEDAGKASEILRSIEVSLERAIPVVQEPSLSSGYTGLALFHGYMAAAYGEAHATDIAERRLDTALDLAPRYSLPMGLFGGWTGIAWTTHHLQSLLEGTASEEANAEFDATLEDLVQTRPWRWEYDLIHGLLGLGCYAADHPDRTFRGRVLRAIIARLAEVALEREDGLTWLTIPDPLSGRRGSIPTDGYFCMGLAHGVPGVVGFLARILAADDDIGRERGEAERLLVGAVAWLLANKRPDDGGSVFPYRLAATEPDNSARSAWCYGDPGVAVALFAAARARKREDWEREAIRIAERDCARPFEYSGVVDAELCHGAAGLGHLYNRLYQATGNLTFARAARDWFQRVLAMCRPGEGVAGFSSWWPEAGEWQAESGFLTGVAGIGLALLAAISSLVPEWDRLLLLSLPSERGMCARTSLSRTPS